MAEDISKGTTGFNLPPKISTKIFSTLERGSAILKLVGGAGTVNGDGEIFHAFSNLTANEVEETGVKTLSAVNAYNVELIPRKFYVGLPFSDELSEDHPEIVEALLKKAGPAIANKFDAKVFSTDTTPGFTSLGSLSPQAMDSRSELFSIIAGLDGIEFGLAISTAYLGYLISLQNLQGNDEFKIERNATDPTVGYINDIPYATFKSASKVALVGDWKENAVAKQVKGVSVKFKYAGFKVGGEDIATRNMFVGLAEQRIAFAANPLAGSFALLTPSSGS